MAVKQDFQLFIFDTKNRVAGKPIIATGVDLVEIAPKVIEEMERHPLGTIKSIMVYDEIGEFAAWYSVADYLNKNIPKKFLTTGK